jgi:hypothetical protein
MALVWPAARATACYKLPAFQVHFDIAERAHSASLASNLLEFDQVVSRMDAERRELAA